jgi:pilus assembly protein Flp/PilA
MKKILISFVRNEEGQDLIEYALLAALISLGCYVALGSLGTAISNKYNSLSNSVVSAS